MATERRPNVLLIVTDDQGWDDLGLHGNTRIRTPCLDRLGRESVRCDHYAVAAVCAATRASLLTGRHFLRTGVAHVHGGKDFVHPDEVMFSELFQRSGYVTGMWGKWHSGKSSGYYPWERGFDEAYMAALYIHRDSYGRFNGEPRSYTGWTTDTITDLCLDFIRRHRDRPFFAFLPHLSPHGPLEAPEELVARYQAEGLSRKLATIYAMIELVDTNTGRLLDELVNLGLAEDTIVLFQSDNGPAAGLSPEDQAIRSVNGYKGHKGDMWENGIKSPLFVRYPRRLSPRRVRRLVDVHDILPTLCELCAVDVPADHPPLDGRSVVPYLEGDERSLPPKDSFVWLSPGWPPDPNRPHSPMGVFDEYRPVAPEEKPTLPFDPQLSAIRSEDWKLMRHPGWQPGRPEEEDGEVLIHIAEDPFEDHNRVGDEADRAADLRRRVAAWFAGVRADPHSFHVPRFRIGHGESNWIGAYAPERIHGSPRNAALCLAGWRRDGDSAEYRVAVIDPGSYAVTVTYRQESGRMAALRLRHPGGSIEQRLDGSGEQLLGTVDLGPGDQQFTLELCQAGNDDAVVLERVVDLVFKPLS